MDRSQEFRPSAVSGPRGVRAGQEARSFPARPILQGVLVDLLQVEGLPYLNADVVPDHQLGQLVPSMSRKRMATLSANWKAPGEN